MASESEIMMIPCFDFCKGGVRLDEESEEWKEMSMKVREALESYGCFIFKCDSPKGVREHILNSMKALFDLPVETKQQNISPRPFSSYSGTNFTNIYYESFAIDDAPLSETVETFTNLMWPQGNPHFCETLMCMSLKMSEISLLILKMIMEGYGLSQHYISDVESMNSASNLRFNKYKVSANNKDSDQTTGMAHTDKNTLTILCQNEVQGLQVLSKTGKWIEIEIPQDGFVAMVGDALKAWSNGRLHAATHRVVLSGDKERYSFVIFKAPKEEMDVEPHELVDEKIHPLRYRPFNYGKFLCYFASNLKEDALEVFAGL